MFLHTSTMNTKGEVVRPMLLNTDRIIAAYPFTFNGCNASVVDLAGTDATVVAVRFDELVRILDAQTPNAISHS
jgi:hypothetical protein